MTHLVIFAAVMVIILGEAWLKSWMRKRRFRNLPNPDLPLEEHLSPSGRYKALVFQHDAGVLRVEVLRLVNDESAGWLWERASGASFADRESLQGVITDALSSASGERRDPPGVGDQR